MTRTALTSLVRLCSIATGLGLLASGCTDDLAPERLDDTPISCKPTTTTYGIDHAEMFAVEDGAVPALETGALSGAPLATDVAWRIVVDQCGGDTRVSVGQTTDTGAKHLPRAVGVSAPDGTITAEDGSARLPLEAFAQTTGTIAHAEWITGDALAVRAMRDGDSLTGVLTTALPDGTVAIRFHATAQQ